MQWTGTHKRSAFLDLVSLPSSISAWLLAGALFFAAVPEVRITASYPVAIPLFFLAIFVGVVERGLQSRLLTNRAVRLTVGAYLATGFLLTVSYVVNALDMLINGSKQEVVNSYAGTLAMPTSATEFFTGTLGAQEPMFMNLLFSAALMPILIFAVSLKSWKELRFLLLTWTAGALFGAAYAVAYCRGFIGGHWEWAWVYLNRASGLTQHPNILGVVSLLAFPGLLLLVAECRNLAVNIAAGLAMVLAWMAIDYSGSRTAAGGVFILIGITYIAQAPDWPAQRRAAAIVAGFGGAGLLLLQVAMPLLGLRPSSALIKLFTGRGSSDAIRDLTNTTALEQALNAPVFGVGYQVIEVAHNIYIQLLHAGGAVGLLGYALSISIPMLALRGGMKVGPQRLVCAVLFGTVATVAVVYWVQSNPSHFTLALIFATAAYAGTAAHSREGFDPLASGKRNPQPPALPIETVRQLPYIPLTNTGPESLAKTRTDPHAK